MQPVAQLGGHRDHAATLDADVAVEFVRRRQGVEGIGRPSVTTQMINEASTCCPASAPE